MKGCCTRCYWLDDDKLLKLFWRMATRGLAWNWTNDLRESESRHGRRLHSPCQPDDHMILKKSRRLDFDWQSPWLTDFDWLTLMTLTDFDWLWPTSSLIDFDRLVKKYRCDLFPSPFHHRACFHIIIILPTVAWDQWNFFGVVITLWWFKFKRSSSLLTLI